mmetsp:Transcript_5213/g.19492  ORF Transcript_5213/g.19492 Transcript_5213/m.19492 type:complete len:338 (+) Transcript_5213:2703-3716(+)
MSELYLSASDASDTSDSRSVGITLFKEAVTHARVASVTKPHSGSSFDSSLSDVSVNASSSLYFQSPPRPNSSWCFLAASNTADALASAAATAASACAAAVASHSPPRSVPRTETKGTSMVTTITFSASIPALTHSVPASALTHCVVCGVLMPFTSTFAAICAEKPFAPWPMRPANGVCSCPPRIAAISGTSSAKRASSGSVWCVRAIIASTSFRNALAAARAKGTHSANTTPLGFFALDNGVEVVHSPNSPIFTPPSSTTVDRGRRSMNLPAASSSTSGCGTPIGTPSPDALASALRVATSDVFSSPSGQAKTFVLITAQRNSPSRAPRISMEWSNS